MRTEVRVVDKGMEADRSERYAVWRRCGRSVSDGFTPVDVSSAGRERI